MPICVAECSKPVCPTCRGKGTHVNPSIDGNGITSEQFDEDPDFREDYFAGKYDITCRECEGKRVIPIIDKSRMSAEDICLWNKKQEEESLYYGKAFIAGTAEITGPTSKLLVKVNARTKAGTVFK